MEVNSPAVISTNESKCPLMIVVAVDAMHRFIFGSKVEFSVGEMGIR